MINNEIQLKHICDEYGVQVLIESAGCVIFYKNSGDSEVIPFDDVIDKKYILNKFEMVADLSKLQMNRYVLD